LAKQGLKLSGGILAAVLSQGAAPANMPMALTASTIKAALCLAATGQGTAVGVISTKVAALTEAMMKTLLLAKLKLGATLDLVQVRITVPRLSGVLAEGSAAVEIRALQNESLTLTVSDTAKIEAKGASSNLMALIQDSGQTDAKDPRIPRIVTSYAPDWGRKALKKDARVSGNTNVYPAQGLLSTVDDLAKYLLALDEKRLITSESYTPITTPYILNDGRRSPYGPGWSTQMVGGHAVHWHYGFDDPFSALLVQLPEKLTSFIFLSNTGAACAPFLLGWGGNVLTSSFALAFLDSELPGVLSGADRDYSRMFLTHYTESALGRDQGEAKRLLGKLRSAEPARFHRNDRVMISVLSDLSDPAFSGEMDSLVEAYRGSGDFHPDISLAIANYYGKTGKPAKRDVFLRQIADHLGYEGGLRVMHASDSAPNSFAAARRKKVGSICGG
jgi:hypothetical protein